MTRNFVSLFSGAMGLDLGIEQAGFEAAVCVEIDKAAIKTIKKNRPNLPVIEKSVAEVSGVEIKNITGIDEIDLLAGGPPCQAFSVFGNRLGIEDARGQLIFEYLRLVEELKPKVFIMENVRGLMSMSIVPNSKKTKESDIDPSYLEKGALLNRVINDFNGIGDHVDCFVVNSANYGAPQI
uniref:DNA cytosine methyltransferase n=1 Tax=Vibrio anguillarum TaxID=55601 RepID=UPI00188D87D7